jgi:hypothetical protein
MLLFGKWTESGDIAWRSSERIVGDPARTTRGMVEPTIVELDDGRILCVMRGSNDTRPELPGYRWFSVSADGGRHFTSPQPWRYDDGVPFYSPSSMSQLIRTSDRRIYWFGNICTENPKGNRPRYPLVAARVDPQSGLIERKSVEVIDDRAEGESEWLTLSNFYVREERGTGRLLLYLPRFAAHDHRTSEEGADFTTDLMVYRLQV